MGLTELLLLRAILFIVASPSSPLGILLYGHKEL